MTSLNGPQLGTLEAMELIKYTARIYEEQKQYKKHLVLNKKSKRHKLVQNTPNSCYVLSMNLWKMLKNI